MPLLSHPHYPRLSLSNRQTAVPTTTPLQAVFWCHSSSENLSPPRQDSLLFSKQPTLTRVTWSAGHYFWATFMLIPAEIVMVPFFLSCSCHLLQDSSASGQHEGWMSAHISGKCITPTGRHLRIIRKVQAALPVISVSKLRINLHFSYREHYHFYILLLKIWHCTSEVSEGLLLYSFLTTIFILL